MLATMGEPFDDERYWFEVKWDGVRAITYVEENRYHIFSRPGNDITHRYPELKELARLPPGTALDGEIVVPDETGRAHLNHVMPRVHAQSERTINQLVRTKPAVYMVFDQLFHGYERITKSPLEQRRATLAETVQGLKRTISNDGVIGSGKAYFSEILSRGIEGMVAKRLDSRYVAGRRSNRWVKVKTRKDLMTVVIGYTLEGREIHRLILAADLGNGLQRVGSVEWGLSRDDRRMLTALFAKTAVDTPIIPCDSRAYSVEPRVFCLVRYLDMEGGKLRDAVVKRLQIIAE